MPRRVATDDWDDDHDPDDPGFDPPEEWDGDDEEEFGDPEDDDETVECPHCGQRIYEQAEQCPHCGNYISEEEETPRTQTPTWIAATAAITLVVVVVYWVLKGW
jgi:ribosomal protein L37E